MRRIAWLAGLVPVGIAWACSSAGSHPNALEGNPGQDSGYIVPVRDTGVSDVTIKDTGGPDTLGCFGEVDGGCNQLQLCGPELTVANSMKTAPVAMGGTIVDGTYLLTSSTFYQSGPELLSSTMQAVFQITTSSAVPDGGTDGGAESGSADAGTEDGSAEAGAGSDAGSGSPMITLQQISQQPGTSPVTSTWAITLLPSASFNWSQVCPSGNPMDFQMQYTATPTTLSTYLQATTPPGIWEATYTKQ
jgi:hypothetical protein